MTIWSAVSWPSGVFRKISVGVPSFNSPKARTVIWPASTLTRRKWQVGDQDTPAWEASLLVHRHAPHCGLAVLPFTGHTLPVEEPELFNSLVDPFLAAVDSGRWGSWRASA